jgi:tRNA1Val (adenine37-N6)-methyltransferase
MGLAMRTPQAERRAMAEETTLDGFLEGRLMLHQPRRGYRAGMDAMVLAAAVAGLGFEAAAELGCGVGAALLSAAVRHPAGTLTGIEKDGAAAALAACNIAANGLAGRVNLVEGDGLPANPALDGRFDLVFSNPPFFDDGRTTRAPAPERAAAWVAGVPLEQWLKAMLRLAAPRNGRIVLIHRADRLGDILRLLPGRAGDVAVYPLRPRADAPALRVLVTAQRGSRAPLRLLRGLDLHPPDRTDSSYTPESQAALDGGPLPGWT